MPSGKFRRLISEMELIKYQIQNKILKDVEILQMEEFKSVVFLCSGPLDSPYEGYWFRVQLEWPQGYPLKPPKCKLLDKIWNPYIDFETGEICMDILHENFSPALTTITIIMSLLSLLSQNKIRENNDGFINPVAAIEMLKNCPYFNQHARELCQKHSFKKKEIYSDNMRGIPQQHVIQVQSEQMAGQIQESLASQKFNKKPKIHQQFKNGFKFQVYHQQIIQIQELPYINVDLDDILEFSNSFSPSLPTDNIEPLLNVACHTELSQNLNLQDNFDIENQNSYQKQVIKRRKIIKEKDQVLTDDKFKEQVEKHRQKIKGNLQNYGSVHPPSDKQK